MSYTSTTTHFNWPLPEETDLFNGLDDNQMKEDLDEKVYNLEQQSTGDHEAVVDLNARVQEVEQTVGGYDAQLEEIEGTLGEHAERLVNLTNRQTELSRRLNGKASEATIAPEYNEEESYVVGDYVYHNNILYKAIAASATPAGAFDADDWYIAILTNELGGGGGAIAAANVSFDDAVAQLGANNVQSAIVALKTLVDNIPTGGGAMVNFAKKLYHFDSTHLTFTANEDVYLFGCAGRAGDNLPTKIEFTYDGDTSEVSFKATATSPMIFNQFAQVIKAGTVITITNGSPSMADTALDVFALIS